MGKEPKGEAALGQGHLWIRNNIIGLLALFVALSGTAWAAQAVNEGGGKAKAAKKKAKRGPQGARGANGANGANGATGAAGANGSAVAFAAVRADGTLVPEGVGADIPGGTKNIVQADISHVAASGVYCFTPSFTVHSAVASVSNSGDFAGTNFGLATVNVRPAGALSDCPAPATARVRVVLLGSGAAYSQPALSDEPFFVWFE